MDQKGRNGLLKWAQEEFQPKRLVPGLISGGVIGVTEIIFAVSLGSLIFSGSLTTYLPDGIRMALVTAAVIMIATSLISSVPGVIGSTQDSSAVILAVIAAGLASTLAPGAGLATILAAIAVTTLLTGVFFLALGFFKWGGLVRFIPYPVVGGFLAGTGWLLVRGSFGVMTNFPLSAGHLADLLRADQLLLWIPGVLFAVILEIGLRRIKHFMAMPGLLIGGMLVFYLGLVVTGTSIPQAIEKGLLIGQLSGGATVHPLALRTLLAANWGAILGQGGNIAITLVLCVVSLLLNASALELAIGQDVNLNRELKAAGFANLLSGLTGGMVGYHALSLSTLSYRIGARGRLPGLTAGILCSVVLLAGTRFLAYFPRPIMGGLLFFLGLDFLYEWVITGLARLSRADYAIVVLILLAIGTTNFLAGVGVGLVAAVILFVLNYSRINVIQHALSGAEVRSNVERCAYHERVLSEQLGKQIHILELQGFIFFGTANALLENVRARITDPKQPHLRYIILDFSRVSGLDSSAALSFVKGKKLADAQNINLVLTHLSESARRQFEKGGLFTKENEVRIFPDLDHGLEWCEEQLLDQEQVTSKHTPITLTAQLGDRGFDKNNTGRLLKFLERVNFKEGDYLLHQGEEADKLYFIEMGSVSIHLEMENKEQVRLQTLGLGTAVGEPGLYSETKCAASAIADSPVTAYRLTRLALAQMKENEPELAATFHEFAARLLSERLTATTRTLEAVLR